MALNFSGSGQFLSRNVALVTTAPMTFAAWIRPDTNAADACIMSVAVSGNANLFMLDSLNAVPRASIKAAGVFSTATSAGGAIPTVGYTHVVAVFTNTTSRSIWVNGVNQATDTTNLSPTGINNTQIGSASGGVPFNGDIAYPSLWNIALSPSDIATLYNSGNGVDPNSVQPNNLKSFSLLPQGGGPYTDSVTNVIWSLTGLPSFVFDPFPLSQVTSVAVDPAQLNIPMYNYSYYLQPWQGYMDTWPASKLIDCLGINFNVGATYFNATATILGEAGFNHGRVEIGWGSMNYGQGRPGIDDTTLTANSISTNTAIITAFKNNNIRPLITLNSNQGAACPTLGFTINFSTPSAAGDTFITVPLANVSQIIPGKTGLVQNSQLQIWPYCTSVNTSTGVCQMSAPLTKAITTGVNTALRTNMYHPLSTGGQANAFSNETMTGWGTYCRSICSFVRGILGNNNFDLEVWNELNFGSAFLDENNYYNPTTTPIGPLTYSSHGLTRTGIEVLYPIAVDNVTANFPGARIVNGFSNQRPWDSAATMWPNAHGFSRHYYTSLRPTDPIDQGSSGNSSPSQPITGFSNIAPINALGAYDGSPLSLRSPAPTVSPGSFFIPTFNLSCPESLVGFSMNYLYLIRDVQPFPSLMSANEGQPDGGDPNQFHWRGCTNSIGQTAAVWETETIAFRGHWADAFTLATGIQQTDQGLIDLNHFLGAKSLLRTMVLYNHKGVETVFIFSVRNGEYRFSSIPEAFFNSLDASVPPGTLTSDARSKQGAQMLAMGRLANSITPLIQSTPFTINPITVTTLSTSSSPAPEFVGNGTSGDPDHNHIDSFGIFPYQLSPTAYAIYYYVVTRDITHNWNRDPDPLNPLNLQMPDETYDFTLSGITGALNATVSCLDPLDGTIPALTVLSRTTNSIQFRAKATDSPRQIIIDATTAPAGYPVGIDSDDLIGPTSGIVPGVTTLDTDSATVNDMLAITKNLINQTIAVETKMGFANSLDSKSIDYRVRRRPFKVWTAAKEFVPTATAPASVVTRNNRPFLQFADLVTNQALFFGQIPLGAILTDGVTVRLKWITASATTGNVKWQCALERLNTDQDTDSFDNSANVIASATSTGSGILLEAAIDLNTIDGIQPGEAFALLVQRIGNDPLDTMLSGAQLQLLSIEGI